MSERPEVPKALLAALLALALSGGCERPPARGVTMTLNAVNTADKILVLEGETDLPGGSRLRAEIQNRDGKTLLRDEAVVRQGSFFFDFDMSRLSEFSAYRARVFFDPERAPLGVRLQTGMRGEALEGDGVRKLDDRRVYWAETEVLLSETAVGRDWEGRDFKEMDGNERTRLISEMERYLEEQDQDKSTKLALARAYLADEPKEYSQGSRAYLLLEDVARSTEDNRDGRSARELLAEIDKVDKSRKKEAAVKEGFAKGDRYRNDFTIAPGKNLGGFRLGTPYRVAGRYFKLDRAVDFAEPTGESTVKLLDFHNMELTYSHASRRLVAVRTTSPKFKLPEGYGVGSLLQELQQAYGVDAVYTPEWKYIGTGEEGKELYRGVVETEGLEFEITRSVDQTFGIPVDKVSAITVFNRRR
ncbi:MAG: hypothetical protein KC800_15320 [Candidatus Eremiobacteraeota bacterium]|nr:hypothetical protein [Candidatus Eremiobacteraeota bacterium]